jgi:hypothetical protein
MLYESTTLSLTVLTYNLECRVRCKAHRGKKPQTHAIHFVDTIMVWVSMHVQVQCGRIAHYS